MKQSDESEIKVFLWISTQTYVLDYVSINSKIIIKVGTLIKKNNKQWMQNDIVLRVRLYKTLEELTSGQADTYYPKRTVPSQQLW